MRNHEVTQHQLLPDDRGDARYEDKRLQMQFIKEDGKCHIRCRFENFWQGKPFGFNIGYGFGSTSAATENILFYDGKAHKLDDVTFHIPADDYCKPWTFSSSDGGLRWTLSPCRTGQQTWTSRSSAPSSIRSSAA